MPFLTRSLLIASIVIFGFNSEIIFGQSKQDNQQTYSELPLIELSTETTFTPTFTNPTTGIINAGGSATSFYFRTSENDKFQKVHSNANNLGSYIKHVPNAYTNLEKYRSRRTSGILLSIAGGVTAVAGITAGTSKTGEQKYNYQSGQVEDEVTISTGGIVSAVAGSIGLLVGMIQINNAPKYIEKAVIIYNKEVQKALNRNKNISSGYNKDARYFKIRVTPNISSSQTGLCINVSF